MYQYIMEIARLFTDVYTGMAQQVNEIAIIESSSI